MAINEFPIETTPAKAHILQVLADNGFEAAARRDWQCVETVRAKAALVS